MDFNLTSQLSAVSLTFVIGLLTYRSLSGSAKRYPPGPRRLPIIGNLHQVPTKHPWLVFSEWNKVYGGIIYLDTMRGSMMAINSAEIAKDLLDKRSAIYSDRPVSVTLSFSVGFSELFSLRPYGSEGWRKQRKIVSQDVSSSKITRYYSLQESKAAALIDHLLKDSTVLRKKVQLYVGSIIFRVAYGYHVTSMDDKMLTEPLNMMNQLGKTTAPGNFLVDFIPPLKYVPRWMPGFGFLKVADQWRVQLHNTAFNPYMWCKNNLETGKTLMPNLCGSIIQDAGGQLSESDEHALIWAALTMFGGGLDTNTSLTLTFIMTMIRNPAVQKKAQAELDSVVGKDRLPTISDRPQLPYTRSVLAEVLRWGPPAPLSIPHATSTDDTYNGYFIPKGTIIFPNIWHMLHDPNVYANPMEFDPDRFGGDDAQMDKAKDLVFGFGRRYCPGKEFAEGTLFAIISTMLATCDLFPGLDEHGKEVRPEYAYTNGLATFPEAFSLRVKARSPQATALLSDASVIVE
ncbi:putative monooxygenase [Pholiota conissans]|uniref:Monooxygenase n=1 Tax=Pholiota conissans TaxID=109636 RepID=A0A9P5YPF5_9AGAR|nr:putative monooxygenase [Pholiota conissans]